MAVLMHRLFFLLWVIVFLSLVSSIDLAFAKGKGGSVSVRGYVRKDGTYVAPHYRSAPDGNFNNNWSTKGNVNPYTGKEGTKTSPNGGYGTGTSTYPYINPNEQSPNSASKPNVTEKEINIPANAKLNYSGRGWECEHGFYKSGDACAAVNIPANAKLNYSGHGWECEHGYVHRGGSCVPLVLR